MSEVRPRESWALSSLGKLLAPSKIVELGSWHGSSALRFLVDSREQGRTLEMLCVDTWLGSREHWMGDVATEEFSFANLFLRNREPAFINTFRGAIDAHGFRD